MGRLLRGPQGCVLGTQRLGERGGGPPGTPRERSACSERGWGLGRRQTAALLGGVFPPPEDAPPPPPRAPSSLGRDLLRAWPAPTFPVRLGPSLARLPTGEGG